MLNTHPPNHLVIVGPGHLEIGITKSAPVGTPGSEEGEDGTQVKAHSPENGEAKQHQPLLTLASKLPLLVPMQTEAYDNTTASAFAPGSAHAIRNGRQSQGQLVLHR